MRSKQRPSVRDTHLNLTQLGAYFGLSAIEVGEKLTEMHLRSTDRLPTPDAIAGGYCKEIPLRGVGSFYLWHRELVLARFQAAGLAPRDPEHAQAAQDARALVTAARNATRTGIDRIFCIMVDAIPPERYELVNRELEGLNSALRLWQ